MHLCGRKHVSVATGCSLWMQPRGCFGSVVAFKVMLPLSFCASVVEFEVMVPLPSANCKNETTLGLHSTVRSCTPSKIVPFVHTPTHSDHSPTCQAIAGCSHVQSGHFLGSNALLLPLFRQPRMC